jgi:hypothetical protein
MRYQLCDELECLVLEVGLPDLFLDVQFEGLISLHLF